MATTFDLLAFGAHPDDVELAVGGIILKHTSQGYRAAVIDLTRGELATGGDPGTRAQEAAEAARALAVHRETLDLGDCRLEDNYPNRLVVVEKLRQHCPRIVLAPYPHGFSGGQGHPDHRAAGVVVTHGVRMANFKKILPELAPHQVKGLFYYGLPPGMAPDVVVDITEQYDQWMKTLACYRSQFMNPEKPLDYLGLIDTLARYYGIISGGKYAQALAKAAPLVMDDLFKLF